MSTVRSKALKSYRDSDFQASVLDADRPVLVDFYADWCGPCQTLAPVIEELAEEYQGRVEVGKMDTDANRTTPMKYGITGIPTLILFKDGEPVDRIVGLAPAREIRRRLDAVLEES